MAAGRAAEEFAEQLAPATEPGLIPDPDAVRAVWENAAAAPDGRGPALRLPGDLHQAGGTGVGPGRDS
ncbi:hypothetical protein ABIA33_005091 [Streptacidiphilus sp. MAP12-16]